MHSAWCMPVGSSCLTYFNACLSLLFAHCGLTLNLLHMCLPQENDLGQLEERIRARLSGETPK